LLHEIVDYLNLRMKKEVVIGDVLQGLDLPKEFSEETKKKLAPFATAIGLAERAAIAND
jgi:hypothetical protein